MSARPPGPDASGGTVVRPLAAMLLDEASDHRCVRTAAGAPNEMMSMRSTPSSTPRMASYQVRIDVKAVLPALAHLNNCRQQDRARAAQAVADGLARLDRRPGDRHPDRETARLERGPHLRV